MSQENVEIVRRACEAAARRPKPDLATVNALFHSDHELVSATSRFEGGSLRGARGFRGFLDNWDETWDSWEASVDQVKRIDDERVLVFALARAMGRRSRVPVERRFAMLRPSGTPR